MIELSPEETSAAFFVLTFLALVVSAIFCLAVVEARNQDDEEYDDDDW